DRYESFMRMVREWRHLKMLKRSGRGHVEISLNETPEGACAVLCPACPHPGKNMPDGWENAPKPKRWLNALFLAIDANFRLKRRHVSSEESDPSLGDGVAYMVKEKPYKEFLSMHAKETQDRSSCASHKAVNMADSKAFQGLAATGLGTIDCARHNMKMPCGCGDLQKGEKYANMDYLYFSSIRGTFVKRINTSYDIACQWWIKLWSRVSRLPTFLSFDPSGREFEFLVPKFHLSAHIAKCQISYSFNFTPGVGRTDGEGVERGWANINPVASSTKEMGPGNRRDTLDDFFGDWNWKKLVGLGAFFTRKIKEAIQMSEEHGAVLADMEDNIPEVELKAWTDEVQTWEDDHSKPNPFESKAKSPTLPQTRLKVAREDALELAKHPGLSPHSEITPGSLVSAALDLEEQQRRLRVDRVSLGQHAEDSQLAALQQRSNGLRLKLNHWFAAQSVYMPAATSLRAHSDNAAHSADRPEIADLFLPSNLPRPHAYPTRFYSIEWDLRIGQAHDALARLRSSLQYGEWLYKYKDKNLRGQEQNTRQQKIIDANGAKIRMHSRTYRAAYLALVSLGHDNETQENIQEGVWLPSAHLSFLNLVSDIRVQWCKSRARAHRWSEEVELLQEEMGRVLRFLEWHASWWEERVNEASTGANDAAEEGMIAYGLRQAALRRSIAARFSALWEPYLESSRTT
ncbi:hypothetical protein CONPUDRAFT_67415, partial [Coniophora puteana RWD-64-598 SS2]